MPVHGEFKFRILEPSIFFFFQIFDPPLVDSADAEPVDMEGQL